MINSIRLKTNISKPVPIVNRGVIEGITVFFNDFNIDKSKDSNESIIFNIQIRDNIFFQEIFIDSIIISIQKNDKNINNTLLSLSLSYEHCNKDSFYYFLHKICSHFVIKNRIENHFRLFKIRIEKWC